MMTNDVTPTSAAPASGLSVPAAAPSGAVAPTGPYAERERLITENLKQIYDPEIPMNIVDLGLIYGFEWAGDDVTLKMTLTSPGCPVAGILAEEIKGAVEKVPAVHTAKVDMIWDPPWSPERMSEFAKRQFGYM
ncbi:MAG: iron-sulfur cluster assembly protein [Thermoplasmata archaeon]|nr:iron-sulfur cluster assembly protein [Thermoplasmata archaeon]